MIRQEPHARCALGRYCVCPLAPGRRATGPRAIGRHPAPAPAAGSFLRHPALPPCGGIAELRHPGQRRGAGAPALVLRACGELRAAAFLVLPGKRERRHGGDDEQHHRAGAAARHGRAGGGGGDSQPLRSGSGVAAVYHLGRRCVQQLRRKHRLREHGGGARRPARGRQERDRGFRPGPRLPPEPFGRGHPAHGRRFGFPRREDPRRPGAGASGIPEKRSPTRRGHGGRACARGVPIPGDTRIPGPALRRRAGGQAGAAHRPHRRSHRTRGLGLLRHESRRGQRSPALLPAFHAQLAHGRGSGP